MVKLGYGWILGVVLTAATLMAIGGLGTFLWRASRPQNLTLAAGSATGESYILSGALKQVLERHYPNIHITLLETGGTAENLRMLEDGRAQLATAQADVTAGASARIVAVLYDDTFQLLVRQSSGVQSFAGLRGRSIGLPQSGGQFQSFLRVAEHFGLRETDFRFVGASDTAAGEAFLSGQADAVFRVRTLGDPSIQQLMQSAQIRFLPIEHAAAMKIKHPAFEPGIIPQGAYLGDPPVPALDLPTVLVHRNLLAHENADEAAIRAITGVLMERRQEIMQEIPLRMTEVRLLLNQVHRPDPQAGLGPPPHPGATSFFDKDKPSFVLAHADYVGLMLTVVLMAGSWVWEIKRWVQKSQKNAADLYSRRAVELMGAAQAADSVARLDEIWRELLAILTEAVRDLDADKLSEESFASFRSILNIALEVTKERRTVLVAGGSVAVAVAGQ